MKKALSFMLTLLMVLTAFVYMPNFELKADAAAYNINGGTQTSATFILDPGHGGSDPGACSLGRQEAPDVLAISLKIGQHIINSGASVSFTRVTDMTQSLAQKVSQESSGNFSYFLSVHRNAGGGTGVETFYYSGSTAGYNLAYSVNTAVVNATGWRNRGLKTNSLYVVRNTTCTAALIELGFIDTAADNEVFVNKNDDIAKAVASGLLAMIGKSLVVPNQLTNKLNGNSPVTPFASGSYVKFSSQSTEVVNGTYLTRNSDNTVTTAAETASNNQVWKVQLNSDSTYTFINAGNGYCLDINGAASADGTVIQCYAGNSTKAQKFYMYNFNGGYLLRASYAQNAVVDIDVDTGSVFLWSGHYAENQRYNIQRIDVGGTLPTSVGESFTAKIRLPYSGKFLTYNGDNVEMGTTGCDWQVTRNANGTYSMVAVGDGRRLDVNGGVYDKDTNMQLWEENTSNAQKFYIYNKDGLFYFKPNGGDQLVIDIDDASQNAHLWTYGTSEASLNAQRFQFYVDRPTDADYLPIDAINGSQDAAVGQVWTTGTFTGTACGTIVVKAVNGSYVIQEKYLAGAARSIAASATNIVISVHSSLPAYNTLADLSVGDTVVLGGIQPWQSVAFTNAYVKIPAVFKLKDDSIHILDESYVTLVGRGHSVSTLTLQFQCTVSVYDMGNNKLADGAIPGTGCTVKRLNSTGDVVDSATVVIIGDVDGNGVVTAADFMTIASAQTGTTAAFTGAFSMAADANNDGAFSAADYLAVAAICTNG